MDGAELVFEDGALGAIAELALERKTGARGLRAIMEELLVPIMYELPDREDITAVHITEACVKGEDEPSFVYTDAERNPPKGMMAWGRRSLKICGPLGIKLKSKGLGVDVRPALVFVAGVDILWD